MLMNFKFYVKRFLLSLFLVLASTMLYAQKKADITGTVYDSDGTTPAVGCAVTIEGTPTGVITDINGKYKIRGGETQTLVFSSIIGKTKCDGIQNQMRLFGGRVSPKRKATKISHTHTKKHRSNGF